MADEPKDPGIARAEELIFARMKQALEDQGTPESALYLRHLVSARLESDVREGPYRRVRFKMCQRTSDYTVQLNALTGEQRGWYFAALRQDPGRELDPAQALEIATRVAAPPEGAELEHAGYEEQADEPVFVARWRHVVNGIPVERDYIHVLVNGSTGKPFLLQRSWHEVDEEPSWR